MQNSKLGSLTVILVFSWIMTATNCSAQTQENDPAFDSKILQPAYQTSHPRVLIDAAHNNVFSTSTNRIDPLVQLWRNDGMIVGTNRDRFTEETLHNADMLAILTANGVSNPNSAQPAFTETEIEAVYAWVVQGGTMLFCLDHYPFGESGRKLAERFGVQLFTGYVEDAQTSDKALGDNMTPVYSRSNAGLADHFITRGRNAEEHLQKVAVFGGESLKGPEDSSVLFRVSATAINSDDRGHPGEGLGTAQALALMPGKGRVVITADCTMWTAQLVYRTGTPVPIGMSRKDFDNRQFALNVAHWLLGAIK